MRATSPTWLFTRSTRGALLPPRPGKALGTERSQVGRERLRCRLEHRVESRLRDPLRVLGSCLPPIRRCLIRRGPEEEEGRRVAAAVVGVREVVGALAALVALAAAEVPAVVAEQAVPGAGERGAVGAGVVRGVRVGERVAAARAAARAAELVAECRTPTCTIRRTISRGPSFRLFQRR